LGSIFHHQAVYQGKNVILIWSRWGIVVAVLALLGLGTGFLIQAGYLAAVVTQDPERSSTLFAGLGLAIAGGYIWLFERYVLTRHLDKPRQYSRTVPLDQPQTLADGTVQTHVKTTFEARPRSTFFFVPFKYWWIISAAIGGLVFIVGIVVLAV
jgi:hypothetical protein